MDTRYRESEVPKFFDMMAEKGVMNAATARSRKFAIQRVFSVLDDEQKADVRKIDRAEAVRRFMNKFSQDFHPDSLATYAHRFNAGLDDFIAWVDNPMGFRPSASQRATRSARSASSPARPAANARPDIHIQQRTTTPPTQELSGSVAIPIPLPSGALAQLVVPEKITSADADRIAAVAKALAVGNSG